ncbi:MAG: hypothetical protein IPJ23_05835 [Ignavibacteriales bacterium]|nr:hypothetical protein [Ignavibacteriales bacterium]
MQAFVELLDTGKLKMERLITHVYDFEKATDAYDMILKKEEQFVGVVLKYDAKSEKSRRRGKTDESVLHLTVGSLQKPRY